MAFFLFFSEVMALLRSQKKDLAKKYIEYFNQSINIVVLTFDKIPVNELNQLRIDLVDAKGVLQVVKKRILLKALAGSFEGFSLDQASATVMMLYAHNEEDEHAPVKVIQKYIKKRTKAKTEYKIDYIGWRYEKNRHQSERVRELASLPTKEELIGKLLFLLNHPVSSLARAFQAIADTKGGSTESSSVEKKKEASEVIPQEEIATQQVEEVSVEMIWETAWEVTPPSPESPTENPSEETPTT